MSGGWERIARHDGGSVFALATAPTVVGGTTVFAATAAGLFSSLDAGSQWRTVGDVPLPLLGAVVPSPRFAENRTLYAGSAMGFFRSVNAGQSWRQTLGACHVYAIACMPGQHAEDCLFIGTDRDGVLRSDDAGRTWNGANPGLLDRTVLALAFSPDTARDQTGFAATASGLYRTRNGGKSWREVEVPHEESAVQCLAVSPAFSTDGIALAGTEGDGLWRSEDRGATWAIMPDLAEAGVTALAFSPRFSENGLIAAATAGGLTLSRDGGATWQWTEPVPAPVISLAFVMDGGAETLVAGLSRAGIARLRLDTHETGWIVTNAGLGAMLLTSLCLSPKFESDRTMAVAGPEAGIRLSHDGGATWTAAHGPDATVFGLTIVPRPDGTHTVFAATNTGIHRSHNGAAWDTPSDVPCILISAEISTSSRSIVFAATFDGDILASENGGDTWRVLGTPFHGTRPCALACAPQAANGSTLYAGTTHEHLGMLWRSTDGGATWARRFEERGDEGPLAIAIPRDANAPAEARGPLIGYAGRVWQPRPHAWQVRGDARFPLWSSTPLAAPDGEPLTINALAASPAYESDGMVFAATSAGVFRSRNHGRTFDWWSDSLVPIPVLTLAVASGDASTRPFVHALGADSAIWCRAADD